MEISQELYDSLQNNFEEIPNTGPHENLEFKNKVQEQIDIVKNDISLLQYVENPSVKLIFKLIRIDYNCINYLSIENMRKVGKKMVDIGSPSILELSDYVFYAISSHSDSYLKKEDSKKAWDLIINGMPAFNDDTLYDLKCFLIRNRPEMICKLENPEPFIQKLVFRNTSYEHGADYIIKMYDMIKNRSPGTQWLYEKALISKESDDYRKERVAETIKEQERWASLTDEQRKAENDAARWEEIARDDEEERMRDEERGHRRRHRAAESPSERRARFRDFDMNSPRSFFED